MAAEKLVRVAPQIVPPNETNKDSFEDFASRQKKMQPIRFK